MNDLPSSRYHVRPNQIFEILSGLFLQLKLEFPKLHSIPVLKILSIVNKEQGVFLAALIRNTTSQMHIRNNSLKQGTGGNHNPH